MVGSGLKISQPLPATDSFPSAPRKLSMSLDDMLHQMNEEEVQEEKSRLSLYLLKSAGTCVYTYTVKVYIHVYLYMYDNM